MLLQQLGNEYIQDQVLPLLLGNVHPDFLFPVLVFAQGEVLVFFVVVPEILQGTDIEVCIDLMSFAPETVDLLTGEILGINDHNFVVFELGQVVVDAKEHAIGIQECGSLLRPRAGQEQRDRQDQAEKGTDPFKSSGFHDLISFRKKCVSGTDLHIPEIEIFGKRHQSTCPPVKRTFSRKG